MSEDLMIVKKAVPNFSHAAARGEVLPPAGIIKDIPKDTPKDLSSILKAARVRVNDVYAMPPKAISFIDGEEAFTYGTLGNFSLVTGKAKSKKTFLMCLVLAACLGLFVLQGKIKCELPAGKPRVILFDTEQSKYHVWKKLQAIASLCGITDMGAIEVYSLREFTPADRCELINYLLIDANEDKSIGLVVVDGIRDLINDINDPKEATGIATKLMQWTTLAWCHIITVLHQNKNDTNARGHVGAELINKAETCISVTVAKDDKGISVVEAEMTRDKDLPPFAFRINELGLPEILSDYKGNEAEGKKQQFDTFNLEPGTHHAALKKIYATAIQFKRGLLISELTTAMAAFGFKIGQNKAKELISYYSQQGWLKNEGQVGKEAQWRYYPDPVYPV